MQVLFETERPADYKLDYAALAQQGVKLTVAKKSAVFAWHNILMYCAYMVALVLILRRMSGAASQAKSDAGRRHTLTDYSKAITFADVAGVEQFCDHLEHFLLAGRRLIAQCALYEPGSRHLQLRRPGGRR